MNIDIYDTNNHVTNKKIEIGFAAKTCLIKEDLGIAIEAEFKHQCLLCYQSICFKLKDRSPLKYEFVLALRSLSPQYINHHPNQTIIQFEKLLTHLITCKLCNPSECDVLMKEYKCMVNLIRLNHKEKFAEFNLKSENDRLDTFYYDIIGEKAEFNEL